MNIHNNVDTILYHTVDCTYNTPARPPATCSIQNCSMLLPRASLWTHTPLRRQWQHSNAVNVNTKERHCKLLHCNLQQDKSSSKSINGGLFKPRKQLLALGSIFAVLFVNYNNDIWQCGNGGDQRWCDTCVQVDMACDISEYMFLHFIVVSANVIFCLLNLLLHNHIDRWLYRQVQCSAVFTTSLTPTTNDDIWHLTVPFHLGTAG